MHIARISELSAIFAAVGLVSGAAHANESCMAADGQASVAGILASENGAYILTVGAPICLKGEEELDNVAATTRLQVFPGTEPVQGALATLVGKAVAIKGSLHGSRSKKFNAPILVDVSEAASQ